jgi:ribosomal protein S18 acetylase RimI-like enzyme
MIIRKATKDDVEEITRLWIEFIDIQKGYEPFFTRAADGHVHYARLLLERLDDKLWNILVAEVGGEIAGYCYSAVMEFPPVYVNPKYGYIYNMAVTARYQNMGVAQKLFDKTFEWFKDNNLSCIQGDVISSNKRAHSFWQKMGFTVFMEKYFRSI